VVVHIIPYEELRDDETRMVVGVYWVMIMRKRKRFGINGEVNKSIKSHDGEETNRLGLIIKH